MLHKNVLLKKGLNSTILGAKKLRTPCGNLTHQVLSNVSLLSSAETWFLYIC